MAEIWCLGEVTFVFHGEINTVLGKVSSALHQPLPRNAAEVAARSVPGCVGAVSSLWSAWLQYHLGSEEHALVSQRGTPTCRHSHASSLQIHLLLDQCQALSTPADSKSLPQ